MAAWKTLLWEGELAPGQTVLVLGATGTSGRIATQLAVRRGARVVAAGRNQRVLAQLVARGADAMIRVDRPREGLAEAIAAEGPYDLIVDYLWGAPAEAAFAALTRADQRAADAPERIRYIQVGIGAGAVAELPAMTLRTAPSSCSAAGSAARPPWRRHGRLRRPAPPGRRRGDQPRHRRRAARQGRAGLATGRKRPARRLRALTAGGLDPGPRRPGAPGGDVIA